MFRTGAWASWAVAAGTLLQGLVICRHRGWTGLGILLCLLVAGASGLLARRAGSARTRGVLLTLSLGGLGMLLGERLGHTWAATATMLLCCLPGCCLAARQCTSGAARWLAGAGCVLGMTGGMWVGGLALVTAGLIPSACHAAQPFSALHHLAMLAGMTLGALAGGELASRLLLLDPFHPNRRPDRPTHQEAPTPWLT